MKKFSFLVLFSALTLGFSFMGCDDSGSNDSGNGGQTGETKSVCDCSVDDDSCLDKCIREVCECPSGSETKECAANCEAAGACEIVKLDGDIGSINPFDPSSWQNISYSLEITKDSQVSCLKSKLPSAQECDSNTKATCESGKVKYCDGGSFKYKECESDQSCVEGSCQPNSSGSECDSNTKATCESGKVKYCDGGSFKYKECESDQSCVEGSCQPNSSGSECVNGSSRCSGLQASGAYLSYQTCKDGAYEEEVACGEHEVCCNSQELCNALDSSFGKCVPQKCEKSTCESSTVLNYCHPQKFLVTTKNCDSGKMCVDDYDENGAGCAPIPMSACAEECHNCDVSDYTNKECVICFLGCVNDICGTDFSTDQYQYSQITRNQLRVLEQCSSIPSSCVNSSAYINSIGTGSLILAFEQAVSCAVNKAGE